MVSFSRAYLPIRDEDGGIVGVLTVISELSDVARALSGVADLSSRLATALTVDDVVREALRHAMALGADHARLVLPEGAGLRMARRAAADPWDESTERLPPLWAGISPSAELPSVATQHDGAARWLQEPAELQAFAGLAAEPIGSSPLRSAAAVPLPVGPWRGALSLGWHRSRRFSPSERTALITMGTLLGAALARAQRFDDQFGLADTLQRSLLPTALPHLPGLVLGSQYQPGSPGTSVGGAFYDAFPLPDGRLVLAIGDVAGRGAGAATIMGQTRAALRALALQQDDPAAVLTCLDEFVRSLGAEVSVGALIAIVDESADTVLCADAGHPVPLIRYGRRRPGGALADYLDVPVGPPLGASAQRHSSRSEFAGGDLLLLFTEGLLTAAASRPDAARLAVCELAAQHPEADPRRLGALVLDRFSPSGTDDIALLVAHRVKGRRRSSVRDLPGESDAPRTARRWTRELLGGWGVDEDQVEVAVLCLNELVTNALLHARSGSRVELDLDDSRLLVLVRDEGQASSLSAQLSQTDAVRGRGLALVEQLSDAWGTERDSRGTTVWFELARQPTAAAAS
jgi:anti-sigma regulatory factor (Ser/Thr protein kinase)